MRQLVVSVPESEIERAVALADEHRARNVSIVAATGLDGGARKLMTAHLSNSRVGPFIGKVSELADAEVTLAPRGVITLHPPASEAPDQVKDVEMRSPIEIFLAGLQSIGSWRGFLSYAAASGFVVWIGLFTNTIYLLTAAMLIAPFAGPAMNLAIGTSRGDAVLMRRSAGRYFAALGVTIFIAMVMSLIMRQEIATTLMIDQSQVSSVALLLPLVAGAAGALNLLQSERSSLVSGAAVGMLVAASIAPPAGLIGMSIAIREWDLLTGGVFRLLVQLAGINVAGAIVFRLAGVRAEGSRFERGSRRYTVFGFAASVVALLVLGFAQFSHPPELTRSSEAQRATSDVREAVERSGIAHLVEANVRFTRSDIPGQKSLLCVLYVQPRDSSMDESAVRDQITSVVRRGITREGVTPLVSVNVVSGEPGAADSR